MWNLITNKIEDFTGHGIEDLRKCYLRTPQPPLKTFTDDPLRVLRVIRFASQLGAGIHPAILAAALNPAVRAALLRKIKPERIVKEFTKMMTGPNPTRAFELLGEYGLLDIIFPTRTEEVMVGEDEERKDEDGKDKKDKKDKDYMKFIVATFKCVEVISPTAGTAGTDMLVYALSLLALPVIDNTILQKILKGRCKYPNVIVDGVKNVHAVVRLLCAHKAHESPEAVRGELGVLLLRLGDPDQVYQVYRIAQKVHLVRLLMPVIQQALVLRDKVQAWDTVGIAAKMDSPISGREVIELSKQELDKPLKGPPVGRIKREADLWLFRPLGDYPAPEMVRNPEECKAHVLSLIRKIAA
jgi:hypothetical protein